MVAWQQRGTTAMDTATDTPTHTAMVTVMTTIIPMATADPVPAPVATGPASALLQTLWLASPTLPVGGFSYSEGLEAAVDAGAVHDEASAAEWLADQLHLGLARSDLAVVAQAIPAWQTGDLPRIRQLNDWVLHTRETQEFRLQTEQMGRSLMEWARSLGPPGASAGGVFDRLGSADLAPPTYPVAMACACACACAIGQSPVRDRLMGYAFGWADNMVQAAIKSVPLGQSAGQRILARLVQEIPAAVDHAIGLTDDTRQAFTPLLAILSARHETQYSRLFRS